MNSDLNAAVAVSAPGKVLLAGGYLVLDRDYTGLVFGLDARIHVHIARTSTTAGVSIERIVVRSPQFREAIWEYGYRITEAGGGVEVTQLTVSAQDKIKRNPFVETTLNYVLTYIVSLSSPVISPSSVTILADDSYYTQPALPGLLSPSSSIQKLDEKAFSHFGVRLSDAHKTGLGSSAALVTSLTAALLLHYLPNDVFSLDRKADIKKLHNLAQTAHCAAQGKVGSGFDVASAVYGSCLYRRFSPSLLDGLGSPATSGFAAKLKALVDESSESTQWDTEIQKAKVKMPKGVRMVMCDVDCGSETPGMVRQVLAWRKTEPEEAEMLWTALHRKNEGLAATLTKLAETPSSTSGSHDFAPLKTNLAEIRHFIREMSRFSGVPIEPPPQTQLIDACSKLDGVIGGVVPGAGGYDAIVLLVEDKQEVLERLDKYLSAWKVETLAADGKASREPSIGRVSRLPVREEMEGVRVEGSDVYSEWMA